MKQDDGSLPVAVDGDREASWIVADYLDVVLHVFTPDARRTTGSRISGRMSVRDGRSRLGLTRNFLKLHLGAPGP